MSKKTRDQNRRANFFYKIDKFNIITVKFGCPENEGSEHILQMHTCYLKELIAVLKLADESIKKG